MRKCGVRKLSPVLREKLQTNVKKFIFFLINRYKVYFWGKEGTVTLIM